MSETRWTSLPSPDPVSDPEDAEVEREVKTEVERLTQTEKEIIAQVLLRDETIRDQEKERLNALKDELIELKEQGVPESSEEAYGRVCLRCRAPLGLIINSGALCPLCEKKVCKICRVEAPKGWMCTVCNKEREIKAESGAWFYDNALPRKKKFRYGSALLRKILRRKSVYSRSAVYDEEGPRTSEDFGIGFEEPTSEDDKVYVMVNRNDDGDMVFSEGKTYDIESTVASVKTTESQPIESRPVQSTESDVAITSNISDTPQQVVTVSVHKADADLNNDSKNLRLLDLAAPVSVENDVESDKGPVLLAEEEKGTPFLEEQFPPTEEGRESLPEYEKESSGTSSEFSSSEEDVLKPTVKAIVEYPETDDAYGVSPAPNEMAEGAGDALQEDVEVPKKDTPPAPLPVITVEDIEEPPSEEGRLKVSSDSNNVTNLPDYQLNNEFVEDTETDVSDDEFPSENVTLESDQKLTDSRCEDDLQKVQKLSVTSVESDPEYDQPSNQESVEDMSDDVVATVKYKRLISSESLRTTGDLAEDVDDQLAILDQEAEERKTFQSVQEHNNEDEDNMGDMVEKEQTDDFGVDDVEIRNTSEFIEEEEVDDSKPVDSSMDFQEEENELKVCDSEEEYTRQEEPEADDKHEYPGALEAAADDFQPDEEQEGTGSGESEHIKAEGDAVVESSNRKTSDSFEHNEDLEKYPGSSEAAAEEFQADEEQEGTGGVQSEYAEMEGDAKVEDFNWKPSDSSEHNVEDLEEERLDEGNDENAEIEAAAEKIEEDIPSDFIGKPSSDSNAEPQVQIFISDHTPNVNLTVEEDKEKIVESPVVEVSTVFTPKTVTEADVLKEDVPQHGPIETVRPCVEEFCHDIFKQGGSRDATDKELAFAREDRDAEERMVSTGAYKLQEVQTKEFAEGCTAKEKDRSSSVTIHSVEKEHRKDSADVKNEQTLTYGTTFVVKPKQKGNSPNDVTTGFMCISNPSSKNGTKVNIYQNVKCEVDDETMSSLNVCTAEPTGKEETKRDTDDINTDQALKYSTACTVQLKKKISVEDDTNADCSFISESLSKNNARAHISQNVQLEEGEEIIFSPTVCSAEPSVKEEVKRDKADVISDQAPRHTASVTVQLKKEVFVHDNTIAAVARSIVQPSTCNAKMNLSQDIKLQEHNKVIPNPTVCSVMANVTQTGKFEGDAMMASTSSQVNENVKEVKKEEFVKPVDQVRVNDGDSTTLTYSSSYSLGMSRNVGHREKLSFGENNQRSPLLQRKEPNYKETVTFQKGVQDYQESNMNSIVAIEDAEPSTMESSSCSLKKVISDEDSTGEDLNLSSCIPTVETNVKKPIVLAGNVSLKTDSRMTTISRQGELDAAADEVEREAPVKENSAIRDKDDMTLTLDADANHAELTLHEQAERNLPSFLETSKVASMSEPTVAITKVNMTELLNPPSNVNVSKNDITENHVDQKGKVEGEPDVDKYFEEYVQEHGDVKEDIVERRDSVNSAYSDYSDIDEALMPKVRVAGEILVGLKYLSKDKHFEVQIHRAKDLVAADPKKHTSDPYVKTYLLPDRGRSGKRKTKAKKHSLDPEFDEILNYKISMEELLTRTLNVSVWHHDSLGHNIFLGETNIVMETYIQSGFALEDPTPQWYTLVERRTTRASLEDVGEITFEMMYVPPGSQAPSQTKSKRVTDPTVGKLHVNCKEATNLKAGDVPANPFCKLGLLASVKEKPMQFKTEVENHTLNPYWDEEVVFENVCFSDLHNRVLQISVYDFEKGNKNQLIGGVRLGLGKSPEPFDDPSIEESTAWQKMLDQPNEWISVTVKLRSVMESLKGDASAVPILIKREEDFPAHTRAVKSDSILSTGSTGSFEDSPPTKKKSFRLQQPDQYSLTSFGSMLSIYSDAGGYGHIPISGEILFSIKYDNVAGVFEVNLQKAKNLAAADKKTHSSNPYVKTYLLPDKSKSSKKKTMHRRKTVNPEWKETIKYKIAEKDLMRRTLQVSVWNHDRFGHNDFLGEVQVQLAHYVKSGHSLNVAEPVWYTLQELAPVSVGEPGYQGVITVGLKHDHGVDGTGRLSVEIREAKDLTATDPNELSSPFVKGYLLPDKTRKSKRKTKSIKKSLNPKWAEKFSYDNVTKEDLEARVLELSVWDHDSRGHNFLGGTRLGLGKGDEMWHDCHGKEVATWTAMLEHPGIWVEYSIPLRDSMTSRKGMELNPPEPVVPTTEEPPPEDVSVPVIADESAIRVGLMYISPEHIEDKKKKKSGQLKVHLKEAKHLSHREGGELPTTYCKCFLHPKKKAWKHRTDKFKGSDEPVWDKELIFENLSLDDLVPKGLEISVWDAREGKSDEMLGLIRLGPGNNKDYWDDSSGKEITFWKTMQQNPDKWNYQLIPLRLQTVEDVSEFADDQGKPQSLTLQLESETQDADSDIGLPESPRTTALRAMGNHAAGVVSLMEQNGSAKPVRAPPPEDYDLGPRTLSIISEEPEGSSGSFSGHLPSRVKFAVVEEDKQSTISEVTEPVEEPVKPVEPVVVKKPMDVPKVVIEEPKSPVRPGAAPYPGAKPSWEKEDEDEPAPVGGSNLTRKPMFGSRESLTSMTSVTSDMNPIYGHIPVKGEIQFALKYDAGTGCFQVHVYRARDLAAVDTKKMTSDPYVKTYLMPDKTKSSKKKTKYKRQTLNPEFDEILEYKINLVELRKRTLMVTVWNYDRLGRNIFLGEVLIPMESVVDSQIELENATPVWYTLQEKSIQGSKTLYKGELVVGLMFDNEDSSSGQSKKKGKDKDKDKKKKKDKNSGSRIMVHIKEGNDLPSGDPDGFSDPYCKCYLLPLKQSKTKRKTQVISRTRNAFWDYRFDYMVDFQDLSDAGLEFTVFDHDKRSRNDFLGCARLNLGRRNGKWDDAEGVEIEAWNALMLQPNKWNYWTIPLRSSPDPRPKNVDDF